MDDLRSSPIPPVGDDDRVRGHGGPLLIVYTDFECPYCAALEARLRGARVRTAVRHFPVRSAHPRAWPAACAAEAAALQGRFWEMHDALFDDQAHLEDPHLWARAQRLGLELERFESDRRSEAVRARIQDDFRGGVRGGVVTTPAAFLMDEDGRPCALDRAAAAALAAGGA
jgi:protein-disulfide isomerase